MKYVVKIMLILILILIQFFKLNDIIDIQCEGFGALLFSLRTNTFKRDWSFIKSLCSIILYPSVFVEFRMCLIVNMERK